MDNLKPTVSQEAVASLLAERFGEPIRRLRPVDGGHVAQTYGFVVGDDEFIVRFNRRMGANFEKEVFVVRTLASARVPVPPIVHIGRFGKLHYAISQRAQGTPLDKLPVAEVEALVPAMLETLDAIHAVDVSGTTGFGTIGDDGAGLFPSWRRSLEVIREEEPEWEYYGRWHALFETTFLERDLFDRCPEDRCLVHGGFGFGNVLAQDGKITAVLDWIDAKYGDFLFDVAWLEFWGVGMDYATLFRDHYAAVGSKVPEFEDRLRCYQCCAGLNALRFFAKAGDEAAYRWTRDRLLALAG